MAADNSFTLGGATTSQLRVVIASGGRYMVFRYDHGWVQQFYMNGGSGGSQSNYTPIFALKIGNTVYSSTNLSREDVSSTTAGAQQEVTKKFSGTQSGKSFSVLLTVLYNTSNSDYITLSATIDVSQIAAGTAVSIAYGFDAYVNGCDAGAAIVVPDLGYNNQPNPSAVRRYLTQAQVRSCRLVGGINSRGSGSLLGFFTMGRPFDRAVSTYYTNTSATAMVNSTSNEFLFGPYNVPDCSGAGTWDNGVGVAYDNIPAGTATTINTGLSFTTNLDGELDYEWNHSKDYWANIGDPVDLNLTYVSYNTQAMTGIGFRVDLQGLAINNTCTETGFTTGVFTGAVGSMFYEVQNAGIPAFDTARMDVPVHTPRCGQWVIDANAISDRSRTLPLGTPATLTIPSAVNFASGDTVRACRGDSVSFIIKFPDGVVSSQNFQVLLSYTGNTGSFVSLPPSLPFPADSNSIRFSLQTLPTAPVNTTLLVTITGTDKPFVGVDSLLPTSVFVSVNPPNPLITDDVFACYNFETVISVSSEDATATLNWYGDAEHTQFIGSSGSSGSFSSFGMTVVSDTVFYVVSLSENSCYNEDSVKVQVLPSPALTVAGYSVCSGSSATITASTPQPSDTVYWYDDAAYSRQIAQARSFITGPIPAETVFYVKAVSVSGCPAYDSVRIGILPSPALTVHDQSVCFGSSATLTAGADPSVDGLYWYADRQYTQPAAQSASFTTPPLTAPRTYYVKAVSTSGCNAYDSVTVSLYPLPVLTGNDVSVCIGSSAVLTAVTDSPTDVLYWYTDRQYAQSAVQSASFTTPPLTAPGTYYVKAVSTSGCSAYDSVAVSLFPLPVLTGNDVSICTGSAATIAARTLFASDTLYWYADRQYAQPVAQSASFTTAPLTANRTYYVKAVSENGCHAYDSVKVTVVEYPVLTTDDVTICSGSVATIVATATQNAALRWYGDALYSYPLAPSGSLTTAPLSARTLFYVEATNSTGCVTRDSMTVWTITPPAVVAMNDARICYGDEIELFLLQSDGAVTWSTENQQVRPLATTEYIVTASRYPCPDVHDTITVMVNDLLYILPETLPQYKRNIPYNQYLSSNAVGPQYSFVSGELPPGIYFHPDGYFYGLPLPDDYHDGQHYTFTVGMQDQYGCTTSKEYRMKEMLFVPEVFSPNDDGVNDYFMKGFRLIIFDRLGKKLFEGNDGWDGTHRGKFTPEDTYFYVVFYNDNGTELQTTGFITILK